MSDDRRRRVTKHISDDLAAYWALQWANGIGQKRIAADFGYATSSVVSNAIWCLFMDYLPPRLCPDDGPSYGVERRSLVPQALAAFMQKREDDWVKVELTKRLSA